jgi:hypothetical protein
LPYLAAYAGQGIAPTRRRVEIRGVDVMEIADGLIQHNTIYYDGATFARQIGLLPGLASAPTRPCWPRSTRRPR